jgi:hypothetical protein
MFLHGNSVLDYPAGQPFRPTLVDLVAANRFWFIFFATASHSKTSIHAGATSYLPVQLCVGSSTRRPRLALTGTDRHLASSLLSRAAPATGGHRIKQRLLSDFGFPRFVGGKHKSKHLILSGYLTPSCSRGNASNNNSATYCLTTLVAGP